jgi:hypothetical protein
MSNIAWNWEGAIVLVQTMPVGRLWHVGIWQEHISALTGVVPTASTSLFYHSCSLTKYNIMFPAHLKPIHIWRILFEIFSNGSKGFLYLLFGDNINCNTFLVPYFTFVHCWCHLFAIIRRMSWRSVHCCLTLQVQHLMKLDCWHNLAKDGCILLSINRNNSSDQVVFIITLLSSFVLIHCHVCRTVLSSITESYEQIHRHAET